MVLTLLEDDLYWLTERQKIQNNASRMHNYAKYMHFRGLKPTVFFYMIWCM